MGDPTHGPYAARLLLHHSEDQQVWQADSLGGPGLSAAAALQRSGQPLWLRLLRRRDPAALLRRAQRLRHTWHPNLQRVYDAGMTPDGLYLVEAPATGRPMRRAHRRTSGQFRDIERRALCLLSALAHLQALGLEGVLGTEASLWSCDPSSPEAALVTLVGAALPTGRSDLQALAALVRLWAGPRQAPAPLLEALALGDARRAWCQLQPHPERAGWHALEQRGALELARRLLYEGSLEALGHLALLRPALIQRPALSDYLWSHLGARLEAALAQQAQLMPWQSALLARLPQASGVLARRASQGRWVDLWLCHAPWPEDAS